MSPGTSGIFRSGLFLLCCSFTGTRRLKPLRAGKISPWLYMRNPGIVTVWCKSLVANFGLVLGCIEADASKQILILQHCSRSTRFAHFGAAPYPKFPQKQFANNLAKLLFTKKCQINVDQFFQVLARCCQMLVKYWRFQNVFET